MKIKKNALYVIGFLIILAVAGFVFMKSERTSSETSQNEQVAGDVQKVVISLKNYNYYPQEIRVKAGKAVSISLDNSVTGCFRDFTIPEMNLRKYLGTPQDTLEFTPTEKGTYTFACSMRMGVGKLIVE